MLEVHCGVVEGEAELGCCSVGGGELLMMVEVLPVPWRKSGLSVVILVCKFLVTMTLQFFPLCHHLPPPPRAHGFSMLFIDARDNHCLQQCVISSGNLLATVSCVLVL